MRIVLESQIEQPISVGRQEIQDVIAHQQNTISDTTRSNILDLLNRIATERPMLRPSTRRTSSNSNSWVVIALVGTFILQTSARATTSSEKTPSPSKDGQKTLLPKKNETTSPESWLEQFHLYERTFDGKEIPLEANIHFIDTRSSILIRRESADPETIVPVDGSDLAIRSEAELARCRDLLALCAKYSELPDGSKFLGDEDACVGKALACRNQEPSDGFVLDIFRHRMRPDGSSCRVKIPVSRLHSSTTDTLENGCEGAHETVMNPVPIKKGAEFTISSSDLHHGEKIEIQLFGRWVGDRIVKKKTSTLECGKPDGKSPACASATIKEATEPVIARVPGIGESISVIPVDYNRIVPQERMHVMDAQTTGCKRAQQFQPITSERYRADIAHELVIDLDPQHQCAQGYIEDAGRSERNEWTISRQVELRDSLSVKAKAVNQNTDPKERDLTVGQNAGFLTVNGMKDGDDVSVTIERKVKVGKSDFTIPVTQTKFKASALGFHYAPVGDYRAHYSTATALAMTTGHDASPKLAQNFAYSLYYRQNEPTILDHLGAGVHFAVLSDPQSFDKEDEDQNTDPISLGVGGQITLGPEDGEDAVHFGFGYDVIAKGSYFLIGISLPDLLTLFKKY